MLKQAWLIQCLVLACVYRGTDQGVSADEGKTHAQSVEHDEFELRTYMIERADPGTLAHTLEQLGVVANVVASETPPALIVSADAAGHAMVQRFLQTLDVAPAEHHTLTRYYRIKHRDPAEVAEILSGVTHPKHTQIAIDRTSQTMIVKARAAELETADELVERVDQPQKALTLSMYFVQGSIGRNGGLSSAEGLPGSLHKVVRPLEASGFVDMSLLAPFTTTVQENSSFSTEGVLESGNLARLHFDVRGEVHQGAAAETARFTIRANITKGRGDARYGIFEVETTVTARLGDYVVLAAGPSEPGEHDAVALIVRVD